MDLSNLQVPLRVIISEEDADTDQEMVRLLVRDIRDRRLVPEHQDQVSKVVRCHYTEDCLREVSSAETPRQSSELTFQLLRHSRTAQLYLLRH